MDLSMYDVVWQGQSGNSAGSMPLGGYDMGCNVWAEKNELCVYACQSGAVDENGTLLKLCRIRLWIEDEKALLGENYVQHFHLNEGNITVHAGTPEDFVDILLWNSVNKGELHIELASSRAHTFGMSFDSWRYRDRVITPEEVGQCRDLDRYPQPCFTLKDTVLPQEEELLFYHTVDPERSVWEKLVRQQHLWDVKQEVPNPLFHRTIGGLLCADGMRYRGSVKSCMGCDQIEYHYVSDTVRHQVITLTGLSSQSEHWEDDLRTIKSLESGRDSSEKWWQDYFEKSYIIIDEKNPGSKYFQMGKNYQLFRYMLGCNYYGKLPSKFNGGLFTFDEGKTPDYRMWSGGAFTAQNQRLLYWPMLKSGDFEAMPAEFDYYNNTLSAAKARVKKFFGHDGAFFFEQGNFFGLCCGSEYNWNRDPHMNFAEDDTPFVRLHYSTGLEFALMCLEYHRYSGEDIERYMDWIESVTDFYFEHYPKKDGKLFLFPSTALETYKGKNPQSKNDEEYGCANPMDAVSGLRCIVDSLLNYYQGNEEKTRKYEKRKTLCPDLPVGKSRKGLDMYLPAQEFGAKPFNCELPELYPIFPYSCFGLTDREKELGREAYCEPYPSKDQYVGYSWHQNGIFAARLNLLDEAEKYLEIKLCDSPKRFPTFWGPGHDWTPDHNHGGSGMIQLQEMLVNVAFGEIELLPTWNKNVDVRFRLHLPGKKVVECRCENGRILESTV